MTPELELILQLTLYTKKQKQKGHEEKVNMETRSQQIHQKPNNMTGCNVNATIIVISSFIYEEKFNFACICNYLNVAEKSYFLHIKLELN